MSGEAATSALLTDLYELTMADGYLRSGWADRRTASSLALRHTPFRGAYAVACGLTLPGVVGVRRYSSERGRSFDVLYDELLEVKRTPAEHGSFRLRHADGALFDPGAPPLFSEDLLVPVLRSGKVVYDAPHAEAARRRTLEQLARLAPRHRRLTDPEAYPVVFDDELVGRRARLAANIRSGRFDAWNESP